MKAMRRGEEEEKDEARQHSSMIKCRLRTLPYVSIITCFPTELQPLLIRYYCTEYGGAYLHLHLCIYLA